MLISNFLFAFLVSSTVVSGRRTKLWEKNTVTTANVCENYLTYDRSQGICHYQVIVNDGIPSGILEQFWKSSGLCPPDPHQEAYKFLLSSDMRQNLFHIGSLPHEAVTQVRIHWMLDLVQLRILPDLKIWYNFSYLDELILILKRNNLQPGFELMGNPSNYFTDFENVTQVYIWRDLVKTLAEHYINIFGIEYVAKWNFEMWNEPDHHDFDKLNFTIQDMSQFAFGSLPRRHPSYYVDRLHVLYRDQNYTETGCFLNYYDACSEGLKLADKRLRFGGPGGSCRIPSVGHSPICWALLNHCLQGENFFTRETGIRIDFISFHKKGNGSTFLILEEETETINYIKDHFPKLLRVPFYNDEADPLKNWSRPQWWRADVTYAAMVVKIVLSHIHFYFMRHQPMTKKDVRFGLLSSDNSFLSYFPNQFTQRTMLARFQVNNTVPKYVEFVKKPVYTVFGLLSKLCPLLLSAKVFQQGKKIQATQSNFGVIATECISKKKEYVVIIYNSADSIHSSVLADVHFILNISRSNVSSFRWTVLELNNEVTNPYAVWKTFGMPAYPTAEQFYLMKKQEDPHSRGPWRLSSSSPWKFHLTMLNPGVTLINICESGRKLKRVKNLRYLQIRNTTIQISWQDDENRCILTYYVEYSPFKHGAYVKVNTEKILFPSYYHTCYENETECRMKGFYRIYAVDFWSKHGPFSKLLHVI